MQNDPQLPPTLQECISQLRDHFQAFLSASEALSLTQALVPGVCGEWSAKAVVDHLTGWQVHSLKIFKALLPGKELRFNVDIDAFNEQSVASRKGLSWTESLEAFKDSFQDFDEAIQVFAASTNKAHPGFRSWLDAMIHEYRYHLEHILKAQHHKYS